MDLEAIIDLPHRESSGGAITKVAVSVETAAWMADESRTTLYGYIQSGELKSIKIGRSRQMLVDDLREWLESLRDAA